MQRIVGHFVKDFLLPLDLLQLVSNDSVVVLTQLFPLESLVVELTIVLVCIPVLATIKVAAPTLKTQQPDLLVA